MVSTFVPPAVLCLEDVAGAVLAVTFTPLYLEDTDLGKRSDTLLVDRRAVAVHRGVHVAPAAVAPPKNLAYVGRASASVPPCLGDAARCRDSIIGAGKRSERAGVFLP